MSHPQLQDQDTVDISRERVKELGIAVNKEHTCTVYVDVQMHSYEGSFPTHCFTHANQKK